MVVGAEDTLRHENRSTSMPVVPEPFVTTPSDVYVLPVALSETETVALTGSLETAMISAWPTVTPETVQVNEVLDVLLVFDQKLTKAKS